MKFSTRTTYGLRSMIRLAKAAREESISLKTIADEESISMKYLERLMATLKRAQLVVAEKGAGGGYRLARPATAISAYEIVKPLEGQVASFHCLHEDGRAACMSANVCGAMPVLGKVQAAVTSTLTKIKLSDLV